MARKTSKQTLARPSIARQIAKNIEKIQQRKIIDLEEWHQARHRAENLEATVASDEKLSRLDPLHALYVYAQDMMDILAQQLVHLPECRKLAAAFAEAVEVYRPSYPPESPITLSYFSCWALFDLEVGLARETIADVVIAVSAKLGINANMLGLYRTMLGLVLFVRNKPTMRPLLLALCALLSAYFTIAWVNAKFFVV